MADADARLRDAMGYLRAGELNRAADLLGQVLDQAPDETRALLLFALLRDDQDDTVAATALYRRYLALRPDDGFALHRLGRVHQRRGDDEAARACFAAAVAADPDHAPAFNDLGAALYRLGEQDPALAALDRALALDPGDVTARCNRAKLLAAMHRPEAAAAFRSVLDVPPRSAGDWCDRAAASLQLGALEEAEAACRRAMADDPTGTAGLQARLLLADILDRAGQPGAAQRERTELGRRQRLVTRRCLGDMPAARILLVGGAGCCNLPTDFLIDRTRFDIVAVFLPPDGTADALQTTTLPPIDVAFNVIGDADAGAPFLDRADALLKDLGCPVLNPPARIPATRRDRLPGLLDGIPGLVAPAMRRLDGREAIGDRLEAAVLVRPVGSHGGTRLQRAETPAQLAAATAGAADAAFYVSAFQDYRSADGWFRKYRFAFVGGEVFPVHLAIGAEWMVHYWRVGMAAWMQREEADFLADYPARVGETAAAALRAMAIRLGLDFGGVDCGLLPDGRLLVFEANATMLVHANGVSAAKRDQAMRARDAMTRHIIRQCRSEYVKKSNLRKNTL